MVCRDASEIIVEVVEIEGQSGKEQRERNLSGVKECAVPTLVMLVVIDPRSAEDGVWNLGKEVVKTLAIRLLGHRDVNTATDEPLLSDAAVRIAPAGKRRVNGVAVCGGEDRQRSIYCEEMLAETFIVLLSVQWHGSQGEDRLSLLVWHQNWRRFDAFRQIAVTFCNRRSEFSQVAKVAIRNPRSGQVTSQMTT